MTKTALQTRIDPLAAWVAGAAVAATRRPIPLIATRFDVAIAAGLASVTTRRTFRNDEAASIEATLTFPVPVHATLFALEARIAGRTLAAHAAAKAAARATYEDALDRGKSAVLHEEVLRGIHMLSVGQIAPGAEVEVTASWAMTLTQAGDRFYLHIPLTVGDVYGRSGLPDSDELVHGGPRQAGELSVHCADGPVALKDGRLEEGRAIVSLGAPIDLSVAGWTARPLCGRAADGREVVLRVAPGPEGDAALDLAVLVDRSGSMNEICSRDGMTKHRAIRAGLHVVAPSIRGADVIDLWEFDDASNHLGSTRGGGATLLQLAGRLAEPRGGTEIGRALATVIAESPARDLLLITDGKSHALDVQALARTGRRFSVVLVGEDSLEADVGHLAATTGGEILVADGSDLSAFLAVAVAGLRAAHQPALPIAGSPRQIDVRRAGMTLSAEWRPASGPVADGIAARAVAAFAAGLALPALDAEAATQLAVAEGLVTHLTSLVLVDEAGAVQEGIPAARKIALPTPRTTMAAMRRFDGSIPTAPRPAAAAMPRADFLVGHAEAAGSPPPRGLAELADQIDWDAAPQRLQAGDLSAVDPRVATEIRRSAGDPEVLAVARKLHLDPVALIIALIARVHALASRSAARIARAVLGERLSAAVRRIAHKLKLEGNAPSDEA